MALKNKNGTWVFYGELNEKYYYYYSDLYGQINSSEEACKAEVGIFLWKLTGNVFFVPENIRDEMIYQDESFEAFIHRHGENIPAEWIHSQIGGICKDLYK